MSFFFPFLFFCSVYFSKPYCCRFALTIFCGRDGDPVGVVWSERRGGEKEREKGVEGKTDKRAAAMREG
jgi:hypothetical protein